MKTSHTILIFAIFALILQTSIIVRMTARVQELSAQSTHNAAHARYLKECWNAETQENLSTDTCVESPFWEE